VDIKINEVQPLMVDPRLMPELTNKKSRVIKPITKSKGSLSRKVGDDREARKEKPVPSESNYENDREPGDEVHTYPEDLTSCLRPETDETGDPLMDALKPEKGQVARRLPPVDLLKAHKKSEEVRGLIFNAKV